MIATLLIFVGMAASSDLYQCELEDGGGSGKAARMMLASEGRCIRDGWGRDPGNVVSWGFRVDQPIRKATVFLRYSTVYEPKEAGPLGAKLVVRRDGGGPLPMRLAPLPACRMFEEFDVTEVELPGDLLTPGDYRLELRLSRPEEVWLDAFAVASKGSPPPVLKRDLRTDNLGKRGHFRVIFSPGVSVETERGVDALFEKLERHYRFLQGYLGYEPDGGVLTCGISAKRDSDDGPAHAYGSVFIFDEAEVTMATAGNAVHEMAHCFQTAYAHNGFMPRWLREGVSFFVTCLADERLYGDREASKTAEGHFRGLNPDDLHRAAIGDDGINVVHYFGTPFQPGDRPYYAIWNWVFYQLFLGDRECVAEMQQRLRRDIGRGSFRPDPRAMQDVVGYDRPYVQYLIGDDPHRRRLLEDWGFITWPDASLPELGTRVLKVDCGSRAKVSGVDAPWSRAIDSVKAKKGFSYRVDAGIGHRNDPVHQWFFDDPKHGHQPLVFTLVVPTGFIGHLALHPDLGYRVLDVLVEGVPAGRLTGASPTVIPIGAEATADGEVEVTVRRVHAYNAAIRSFALYQDRPLGDVKFTIRCGKRAPGENDSVAWSEDHDESTGGKGFSYMVENGLTYRVGPEHEWFCQDPRFNNRPLRFQITVPTRWDGFLRLGFPGAGRRMRVLLDGDVRYDAYGKDPLVVPISKAQAQDGTLNVLVQRVEGMNCSIRTVELLR